MRCVIYRGRYIMRLFLIHTLKYHKVVCIMVLRITTKTTINSFCVLKTLTRYLEERDYENIQYKQILSRTYSATWKRDTAIIFGKTRN